MEEERVKEYILRHSFRGGALVFDDFFTIYDVEKDVTNETGIFSQNKFRFLTREDLLRYYQSNRNVIDEFLSNELEEEKVRAA